MKNNQRPDGENIIVEPDGKDKEEMLGWVVHLTHEYYDSSYDAWLLIPHKYSYTFLERVIARLQHIHNAGNYVTEDLSGKQIAYLLNRLMGFSKIKGLPDLSKETHQADLDVFWNWEECVCKFHADENSRLKGEPPYFYPDVVFSDYELDGTIPAIIEMDNAMNTGEAKK